MAEWLILQLPHDPDELVSWMPADSAGQALAAPQSGSLAQAASAARGRRIAVLVPSSDVLMAQVELPVKSGVRLQQVVPFALEEQLAADIETLHFAIGARGEPSGRTTVAVVTRVLMERWLGLLKDAGLAPEVLCTQSGLLPQNPGHVVVMLEGDTVCVSRAAQMPLALPGLQLGAALDVSLGADIASADLIFYATPADWHRRSVEVEALRNRCASLKVQLLNFGPLPLLSPQLPGAQFLNLLSGDYAPQRTLVADWRRWRVAAALALALLALHVAGLSLQRLQQQHRERELDQAIGQIARQALPGDAGSGAVRARIERRLLAGQSGTDSGLMAALAALAKAVQAAEGANVQTLSFHDGALDLQLKARDATNLERVDQALRSNGWQAELLSGSAAGAAYAGHILARAPGATGR